MTAIFKLARSYLLIVTIKGELAHSRRAARDSSVLLAAELEEQIDAQEYDASTDYRFGYCRQLESCAAVVDEGGEGRGLAVRQSARGEGVADLDRNQVDDRDDDGQHTECDHGCDENRP